MASIFPPSARTNFHQFMDLPKELRLKVYEFALATTLTLFLPEERSNPIIFQGIGLLCSSSKIRNEALPVFYAVNQFRFHLDESGPICSTHASNHFAKMRYITISYEGSISSIELANILNNVLDMFPRLHSFSFYFNLTYPRSPLDSGPEAIRKLRQRLQKIRVILFVQDADEGENELQDYLDVIRPHEEWRQRICGDYPHSPTWRFDTPDLGPLGAFRVWSTNWPGCGVEEL